MAVVGEGSLEDLTRTNDLCRQIISAYVESAQELASIL